MKNSKKTYGVSGLIEWQAVIECGQARLKVPFTGGTITGYGVSPATYTTENPVVQAVIERSEDFRAGRIKLVREVAGSGSHSVNVGKVLEAVAEASAVEAAEVASEYSGELEKVEVASVEDARDYLAETFEDVKKSDLKSKKAIKEMARAHGVEFVGVEL